MLKYLTIEEIFIALIGMIGINTIYTPPPYPYLHRLEPDLFSAVDENIINPFTITDSFVRDHDNRKIYIRLKDLILEPIKAGTIKSIDRLPKDKWLPLDFRVESESFWDWLRSENASKNLISSLLATLNREFPKAWQSIIDSAKPSPPQTPKEKMWEEILALAEEFFDDPQATIAGFTREDKIKNILRRYKEEPSLDTFRRRLHKVGIKTKRGRPKAKP